MRQVDFYVEEQTDDELYKLNDDLSRFTDIADDDDNYALLTFALKQEEGNDIIDAYTNVTGKRSILVDGIFTELDSQLDEGDYYVFGILAQVVHMLEDKYNLCLNQNSFSKPPKSLH